MSAYVTHGVFPKESWNKFKADNGGETRLRGWRGARAGMNAEKHHLCSMQQCCGSAVQHGCIAAMYS